MATADFQSVYLLNLSEFEGPSISFVMPGCAVPGCANFHGKPGSEGISFHRFPVGDSKLLSMWTRNMRRENFSPGPATRICSAHFRAEDFQPAPMTFGLDASCKRQRSRLLLPNVVPTIFDFSHATEAGKKKRPLNKLQSKRSEAARAEVSFHCD